jgi:competence protein ComEC
MRNAAKKQHQKRSLSALALPFVHLGSVVLSLVIFGCVSPVAASSLNASMNRPRTAALALSTAPITTRWTVWNVGQGLWVTERTFAICRHFDMGGEHAPWPVIRRLCANKMNIMLFSHWDWDHVGFANKALRQLPSLCLLTPPAGSAKAARKKILERANHCPNTTHQRQDTTHQQKAMDHLVELTELNNLNGQKSSNDSSRVFLLSDHILIPGDSTRSQEKIWALRRNLSRVTHLVLGHHGSKTSTSPELLTRLPNLRQAIASSRKSKYGHPHPRVLSDLKKAGVAVLRTEIWGNLHFESRAGLSKQSPTHPDSSQRSKGYIR